MTLTVERALRDARLRLAASPTAALDAELLLAHALGRRRTWLRAWPEAVLADDPRERFEALLARREAGEPVAYLLGRRPFWTLELEVTPAVLIPRPETELLVECVLEYLRTANLAAPRLLDLGTGSGCIALALGHERPDARVVAVDPSAEAIALARRNAETHGINNVRFLIGDWFGPLKGQSFDVIVANPPYVRSDDTHLQQGDVRFEPWAALDGGADGLDAIRAIAAEAPAALAPGGLLALEHGFDQYEAVADVLRGAGMAEIIGRTDAAGLMRVTLARRPPAATPGR